MTIKKLELCGIFWKDSGELLTPDTFKKYWPHYGNNQLHGWSPPKKIYYTLGTAKSGFSHIPPAIKPHVVIRRLDVGEVLIDGADLVKEQNMRKAKTNLEQAKQRVAWCEKTQDRRMEVAKEDLAKAQQELADLEREQKGR